MKKLLSLLSVLTISGTAVPTTIAANSYQKQENIKNSDINYQQTNNLEKLNRVKREKVRGIGSEGMAKECNEKPASDLKINKEGLTLTFEVQYCLLCHDKIFATFNVNATRYALCVFYLSKNINEFNTHIKNLFKSDTILYWIVLVYQEVF